MFYYVLILSHNLQLQILSLSKIKSDLLLNNDKNRDDLEVLNLQNFQQKQRIDFLEADRLEDFYINYIYKIDIYTIDLYFNFFLFQKTITREYTKRSHSISECNWIIEC